MNVILQTRDYQILKLAYEHQFLLVEHAENHFAEGGYRAACRRLRKLCAAGFLREEPTGVLGRKQVFRVTENGARLALQAGSTSISVVKRLPPATLGHDAIVIAARQRLENFWNARFVCERAIKEKDYREVPDGIFFFPSGRGIAIEVENSEKASKRFVSLLQRWADLPQIAFVLYIATNESLLNFIKKHLPKGPADRPMGVVLWNELASGKPAVWTQRGDVPLFDRREY